MLAFLKLLGGLTIAFFLCAGSALLTGKLAAMNGNTSASGCGGCGGCGGCSGCGQEESKKSALEDGCACIAADYKEKQAS